MKKINIFKIIALSIVAILLVFILVYGIVRKDCNFSVGGTSFRYSNSSDYEIAKAEVSIDSSDIRKLEIHWRGGKINVSKSDDNQIHLFETYDEQVKDDEKNLMRYLVKNSKLTIQFCKSTWYLNRKVQNAKELEVKLPSKSLSEIVINAVNAEINYDDINLTTSSYLKIDSVSGNIDISNTNPNELKIDSVSGKINLNQLNVKNDISIDTVSGDVDVNNINTAKLDVDMVSSKIDIIDSNITVLDVESVSGDIKIMLNNAPTKIDIDTVSGDTTIGIPDNDGFRASLDSVSGNISTNFETTISKKEIIYKTGINDYNFESVSGDVIIQINN